LSSTHAAALSTGTMLCLGVLPEVGVFSSSKLTLINELLKLLLIHSIPSKSGVSLQLLGLSAPLIFLFVKVVVLKELFIELQKLDIFVGCILINEGLDVKVCGSGVQELPVPVEVSKKVCIHVVKAHPDLLNLLIAKQLLVNASFPSLERLNISWSYDFPNLLNQVSLQTWWQLKSFCIITAPRLTV